MTLKILAAAFAAACVAFGLPQRALAFAGLAAEAPAGAHQSGEAPADEGVVEAALPWCGCTRKEFDALKAEFETLEVLYLRTRADRDQLAESARIGKESLKYVEVKWVKKALLSLNQYNAAAVRERGHDKVILGSDYDDLTIAAVRKFQCGKYPLSSNEDCDKLRATGWLTFDEARDAICYAGVSATDEMALLLADWYANGRVFAKDLAVSALIVETLLVNLKEHVTHTPSQQNGHFYSEDYYIGVENRARVFQGRLLSMVRAEAAAARVSTDEFRQRFKGTLSREDVCTPVIPQFE